MIGGDADRRSRGSFEWTLALLLALVVVALVALTGKAGDRELFRIAFPTSLVALAIVARVWAAPFLPTRERWRLLLTRLVPYAAGALVPIGLFVLVYAIAGGLDSMLVGVFVTPFRRVAFASVSPPPPVTILLAVPLFAALWLPSRRGAMRVIVPMLAALWFGAILLRSGVEPRFYRVGWFSAWALLFFVAVDGARLILAPRTGSLSPETDANDASAAGSAVATRAAITLCCLAVGLALVEYPFAAPIYTVYALPLTMMAAVAVVRASGRAGVPVQRLAVGFFLAFGLMRIVPGSVGSLGRGFLMSADIARLELPRAGLLVDPREAAQYEDLIPFVITRAHGRAIWAGPDAPEVYFLSGLPNHTRTFFDFLDAPETSAKPLVERLDALGVAVVVLKFNTQFSPIPTPEIVAAVREAFPHERAFPGFLVFWR